MEAGHRLDPRATRLRRRRSSLGFCRHRVFTRAWSRPGLDPPCARSSLGADRALLACLEIPESACPAKHTGAHARNLAEGGRLMQAVIAVPEIVAETGEQRAKELLMQKICGVPLLIRTAITAARSGANEILLFLPETLTDELIQDCTQLALQYGVHINVARVSDFDPHTPSSWARLNLRLQAAFLWVPWNWVTNKRFLTDLPLVSMHSVDWSRSTYVTVHEVHSDNASSAFPQNTTEGVAVTSPQSAATAERFLIAHSGKVLD